MSARLVAVRCACILGLGLGFANNPTSAGEVSGESPFALKLDAARQEAAGADASRGNRIATISNGYEALLLRVHLIRQARSSIAIQTFIWTNDECGRLLIYELIEAARRGVQVRIIADQLFSDQNPEIVAFLATAHPNFAVKHYRPTLSRIKPSVWQTFIASIGSFRGINQRMHNKVMLVDDAVLLTGGRNIENSYFDHSTSLNYRDRDVVAVGPVVRVAARSFERYWNYRHAVPSRELKDVSAALARDTYRRFLKRSDYDFGPHFENLDQELGDAIGLAARFGSRMQPAKRVEFVADEPGKAGGYFSLSAWSARPLRQVIENARSSIVIQTPYLVLSRPARNVFRKVRENSPGARIRISTNSFAATDNLLAYSANYRLRNDYVRDLKLHVHEFKPQPASLPVLFPRHGRMAEISRMQKGHSARPPFLSVHAKSLVVDRRVAYVGSYNLDPRSENLNTEVGLLIEDEAVARALEGEIEEDMRPGNSWVIGPRRYPLALGAVNALIGGVSSLSPVDPWPVQNSTSFELRPGRAPLPPDHPLFHEHYEDVGPFPGTDGALSTKEILTRLYKAVGSVLTPIL